MKRPAQYEAGIELISELLDGRISEADFDRLQEMLRADADLRQVYMQCVDQEVELSFRPPEASSIVVFPNRLLRPLLVAAAAILVMTLLIFAVIHSSNRKGAGNGENPGPVAGKGVVPPHPDPPPPDPPVPPLMAGQRPVPSAPEVWSFDFESGLPSGWTGEFASSDLPPGSRGAVRTLTKYSPEDDATYRQILPPMAWGVGHFVIREDTHLHLTFKMEKANYLDIFMMTHVPDPDRPDGMMYKFDDARLWAEEGKWRTVSIPLADFKGKNFEIRQFVNNLPPQSGEIAWQIFISAANNDLQMVIDEIRVDRNGPGEIVFGEVE